MSVSIYTLIRRSEQYLLDNKAMNDITGVAKYREDMDRGSVALVGTYIILEPVVYELLIRIEDEQ